MRERDAGTCVAEVDGATLSAWRDADLPPAEMEHLHEHVGGCAVCQATLAHYDEVARALPRQRDLEPSDLIVEAVRARLAQQSGGRQTPDRRAWVSLSALSSVAALILLFVYVLGSGPLGHGRPHREVSAVATSTPTLVPTIGPSTFTSTVLMQDAWSAKAQVGQITNQLDGTQRFYTVNFTPDGKKLLGTIETIHSTSNRATEQAGILDVASGKMTPVGDVLTPDNATFPLLSGQCNVSDGRYVICTDTLSPPDGGFLPTSLWSYDLVSGQARLIMASSTLISSERLLVSHGLLVVTRVNQDGSANQIGVGKQVEIVNLASNTLSQVPLAAHAPFAMEFSWPYLVYFDQPDWAQPPKVWAHNLATGADVALPQLDALYAAPSAADANHAPSLALTGDTLFVSVMSGRLQTSNIPPNNVDGPDAATTLYELDHLFASDAQLRTVARSHGGIGSPVGANDRLVVYGWVAWDRAEDRFVQYHPAPENDIGRVMPSGNLLMVTRFVRPTPTTRAEQVTIYDTTRLGTAGG
jgi:hypothetical protein